VLERPIWSERLARWQFVILVVGVVGMVAHFFIARWAGLLWAAGLVGLGIGAHLVNVGLSVRGFRRWTFTARLVVVALAGLGLTAGFGLALGADRIWGFLPWDFFPTLHAHFHLALLGWVAPIVIGVAARVYPMFLLAREPEGWPGSLQLWGLGLGVPALSAGLLGVPVLVAPAAVAVAAALAGHLYWVAGIVRERKRPALDWGLRFALTGAAFLPAAVLLGLGFALGIVAGPRLGLSYAVLALGGWVSFTIVGMMLKIVPFLVRYRVYAPQVARAPVPTLAQLSWPRAEAAAYALLTAGTLGLAVAVAWGNVAAIRWAGTAQALGSVAFATALVSVLAHLTGGGRRSWRPGGEEAGMWPSQVPLSASRGVPRSYGPDPRAGRRFRWRAAARPGASQDSQRESATRQTATRGTALAMDRWEPYVQTTRAALPAAHSGAVGSRCSIARGSRTVTEAWTRAAGESGPPGGAR
jgi:hypothetical protein